MDDKALLRAYRFAVRQSVQRDIILLIASTAKEMFQARLGHQVNVEYEHPLPSDQEIEAEMEQDVLEIIQALFEALVDERLARNPDRGKKFIAGAISPDQFLGRRWQKKMLARMCKASRLAVDLEWKHNLTGLGLSGALTEFELKEAKASLLSGLVPSKKNGLAFPQKPLT